MTKITDYIKNTKDVVFIDELHEAFPDFTENELLGAAVRSPDIIMMSGKYWYYFFHISSVNISNNDIENIKKIIDERIAEKGFITHRQLAKEIENNFPVIFHKNVILRHEDLILAFKYYLEKDYYFNQNIISSYKNKITLKDVYKEYAKGKSEISLSDICSYEKESGIRVNLEAFFEDFVQINPQYLISKKYIHFDIEKIDNAIDCFCKEDYIDSGEIIDFSGFPEAGYPWNRTLLDFFVYKYSKRYRILVHRYFDKKYLCGSSIIVKRSSKIDSIEKLLVTVLVKSGVEADLYNYPKNLAEIYTPFSYQYRITEEARLVRGGKRKV